MSKYILSSLIAISVLSTPAFAQSSKVAPQIENSVEIGTSYADTITLNDNGSTLILEDVASFELGYKTEREIMRGESVSLSSAFSSQASYGRANEVQLNGTQISNAKFRRLSTYADVIARLEGQNESDWTPFVSAGVGVIQDRVKVDGQVFKDLSPVGRYKAGVEKKINEKATFGVGVGQSFKLD